MYATIPVWTLVRLFSIMLPAFALVPLTYLPPFNPFSSTHFDLTGTVPLAAYWITESAGNNLGIRIIGVLLTAMVVSRPGLSWKRRVIEALIVLLVGFTLLAGLAYLNENVVKAHFAVPRPFIQELALTPPDRPVLGETAAEFYALPGRKKRTEYLHKILTPQFGEQYGLSEAIRAHWIETTGYSFPSGHSFAAMMFATFFLGLGLCCCTGWRLWLCYLLAPWGVAVCYSRTILRVHSPTDVTVGGLEGIVAGTVAFLLVRRILAGLGQPLAAK